MGHSKSLLDNMDAKSMYISEILVSPRLDSMRIVIQTTSHYVTNFYHLDLGRILSFRYSTPLDGERQGYPVEIYNIKVLVDSDARHLEKHVRKMIKLYRSSTSDSSDGPNVKKVAVYFHMQKDYKEEAEHGMYVLCRDVSIEEVEYSTE